MRRVLWLSLSLAALPLLSGCPKKDGAAQTSGASAKAGAAWVVFEIYEAGTGNALSAMIWPKGMPDDSDSLVQGQAGAETRFEGIGRREGGGYAVTIVPGAQIELQVWSPEHEMQGVSFKAKKGENLVAVELKASKVDEEKVPERIRLEAMESLPGVGPVGGT